MLGNRPRHHAPWMFGNCPSASCTARTLASACIWRKSFHIGAPLRLENRQRRRRDSLAATVICSASGTSSASPQRQRQSRLLKFVSDQFLPLALLLGMTTGYCFPAAGVRAANAGLQNLTTTGIFVMSGLALRRGETVQALSSWGAVLFGMLSILLITPLAGVAALRLPLNPPELAFGLAVFCCMPTTLSSGVSLTQAVGGNTALALLLTVGSNLVGICTMPFVLCAVLGAGSGAVQIAPGPLLRSLVRTILTPLLAGAAARAFIPGLAQGVDRRKKLTAMLSATLLACVPWMQISKAATDQVIVQPSALLAAVVAGVVIHLAFLAFNSVAVRALRLGGKHASPGIRRAVVLVGSQKTLPIAVTVLAQLSAFVQGPLGLAVVPCVVAHLSQILLDSMLVSKWLREDASQAAQSTSMTSNQATSL